MASGPGCYACRSPRVMEIDAMLRDGTLSRRKIAATFGLHRTSIDNHFHNGHVVPGPPSSPPSSPPSPGGDLDPVASLEEQMRGLDAIDADALSPSQRLGLYEARRRTAESLARIRRPADTEGPALRELRVAEEMAIVVDDVLEGHPDVRKEVADALREWKARRKE